MWIQFLGLLTTIFTVAAQSYDYGQDVKGLAKRQDGSSRIVVGRLPLGTNGSVPLRLEIRQIKADPYKWDLFILALSMLQYISQDDPLSWYQIAGIHGVPFQPWNGVAPAQGAADSGYCPHSSVLFPTWHRPYLALFEQELFRMANIIAGMFPNATERQSYQKAASDFRLPYWDWATNAPDGEEHFPAVFWNATILQKGPRGTQTIRNPLHAYPFHPKNEDAFIWSPLKNWDETKRAPDTSLSALSPPSHNERVNEALLAKLPEIQQRLFIIFSSYKDYNSFSNKGWAESQNSSSWDSIEAVHDIIHIYGGLKGHMTYVPLSAFDPLFLLHHTATDRLIAMWQTLNPTAWISPMTAGETSYTSLKGMLQDSKTPLTPFYVSSDGEFWNSDMARTTEAFGYAYAEVDASPLNARSTRGSLVKKITQWYGGSSVVGVQLKQKYNRLQSDTKWAMNKGSTNLEGNTPNLRYDLKDIPISAMVTKSHYTEWVANVHVNVEALDGNFAIHFFIGDAPSDGKLWASADNLVGTAAVFAMNRATGSQSKISGSVPLTSSLMKLAAAGTLFDLGTDTVQDFLQAKLRFKVLGSNDEEVEAGSVDGLYIAIACSLVKVPETDASFPEWGRMVTRFEMWI